MLETMLKTWTAELANWVEVVAAIIIGFAAIEAVVRLTPLFFRRRMGPEATEDVRLRLGRWLALALEFELAADIVRTAVAPDWMQIGQLAAIAAIRTLLNYFLQQEIDRAALRQGGDPLSDGALKAQESEQARVAE